MSQAWVLWGLSGLFSKLSKCGRWDDWGAEVQRHGPLVPGPEKSMSVAMLFLFLSFFFFSSIICMNASRGCSVSSSGEKR